VIYLCISPLRSRQVQSAPAAACTTRASSLIYNSVCQVMSTHSVRVAIISWGSCGQLPGHCRRTSSRHWSRRSCHVAWTIVTHCFTGWLTNCSSCYRAFRMRQLGLLQALDIASIYRQFFHIPAVHSAIGVSLLVDLGFGTAFRPLCAKSTCLLNISNGHRRHFCLFETMAHLWLCLRRAGYKSLDIHAYMKDLWLTNMCLCIFIWIL